MRGYRLTYILHSLEFRDRSRTKIGFRKARLLFDPRARRVSITEIATPENVVRSIFRRVHRHELAAIRYEIRLNDFLPIPLVHEFPKGAGCLLSEGGELFRLGGLPMFTKRYSLEEVSAGWIKSPIRVFQFDETPDEPTEANQSHADTEETNSTQA